MSRFVHREVLRFGDLDAMRHLNNVAFLRYFETARVNFARTLWPGRSPLDGEAADGRGWVVGFDFEGQRPRPLDDELRTRLEAARG